MGGGDDKEVALKLLIDLGSTLVVHVIVIKAISELIDDNLARELYCELILVDSNLLHIVLALDADLLLSDEVLDDHISHLVTVGVAVSIEAMDSAEDELVSGQSPIITADSDKVVLWARADAPDPVLTLCDLGQEDSIPCVESHVLVSAADRKVLSV